MKKLVILTLLLALLLPAAAPALAEDAAVIRVTGNASVSLAADYATLQIGVNTRSASVAEAQQENARLMQAVIAAIQQAGIGEKDVNTCQFNVFSTYDVKYDAEGNEIHLNYYQVENMLAVTVRELDRVGKVLDAAMAAGANTTYGIQFSSTQENEAYQKALTRAYQDAESKARVLSEAAGKTLDRLILVDASQGNYSYGLRNVYSAKEDAAAESTAILSGDVSVSAVVMLEYELK